MGIDGTLRDQDDPDDRSNGGTKTGDDGRVDHPYADLLRRVVTVLGFGFGRDLSEYGPQQQGVPAAAKMPQRDQATGDLDHDSTRVLTRHRHDGASHHGETEQAASYYDQQQQVAINREDLFGFRV